MWEIVTTPLQAVRGSAVTIAATFTDDGEPGDPGIVTVAAVDAAGNAVALGAVGTDSDDDSVRTTTLAAQSEIDLFTVTWTAGSAGTFTTALEVIGAPLFTLAEARAWDNGALRNAQQYPVAAIEAERARILDEFESITGAGLVRRYRQDVVTGSGSASLWLPRLHVRAVRTLEAQDGGTLTWTAFTAGELADVLIVDDRGGRNGGLIRRAALGSFASGTAYRVGYEYGPDVVNLELKRAALTLLRYQLAGTNVDPRALTISNETGTTQLSTPNPERNRWYGLIPVDAALANHLETAPVIA